VRIGLSPGDELATRVSRVLLADPRIEALGVPRPLASEPRTVALTGFTADVVIAFDVAHPYVTAALERSTPVVTLAGGVTTLRGDLKSLANALATRLEPRATLVAWTEDGEDLKSGVSVSFPQPLGLAYGTESPAGLAVPTTGQWGGVLARSSDGNGQSTTIAAVDDREYLTAISMAACAISAILGEDEPGPVFLKEAQAAGVEFASTTGAGDG